MTIYQVGEGQDFRTLKAASEAVKPGDTVLVLAGVYREVLTCKVSGVTWQAAERGTAIIDGGWDGGKLDDLINQVSIPADGVAVDGFAIQNCPGRGVGISASNVSVRNCKIDNCSNAGIVANGTAAKGIKYLTIQGNTLTRLGMGRLVGGKANGAMIFVRCADSNIEENVIRGGHGEGIDIDKGSHRLRVANNELSDLAHVYVYFNRCVDCVAEGNTLYNSHDPDYYHDDDPPAGIVFGDERSGGDAFPWQSGNRAIGNIVVGLGKFLQVRNNLKAEGGYDTQLRGHEIAGNTFVAGPDTTAGIDIDENLRGRPHRDSVVRDNVFWGNVPSQCNAPGVTWHNNGWTVTPPSLLLGEDDVYGLLELVSPTAVVPPLVIDNYRPRPDSPLIDAASDGATIGALEPLLDGPPDEPGPDDGRDTAKMIEELQIAKAQLATAALAIDDATAGINKVIAALQLELE